MKKFSPIVIWLALSLGVSGILMWLASTDKEEQYIAALTGSLVGGVVAFLIARWQLHKERTEEREKNAGLLKLVLKQVALEVRDNGNRLKKLETILDSKSLEDKRTWEYVSAITQGLGSGSYNLLLSSGLAPYVEVSDMEVMYSPLKTKPVS